MKSQQLVTSHQFHRNFCGATACAVTVVIFGHIPGISLFLLTYGDVGGIFSRGRNRVSTTWKEIVSCDTLRSSLFDVISHSSRRTSRTAKLHCRTVNQLYGVNLFVNALAVKVL